MAKGVNDQSQDERKSLSKKKSLTLGLKTQRNLSVNISKQQPGDDRDPNDAVGLCALE